MPIVAHRRSGLIVEDFDNMIEFYLAADGLIQAASGA